MFPLFARNCCQMGHLSDAPRVTRPDFAGCNHRAQSPPFRSLREIPRDLSRRPLIVIRAGHVIAAGCFGTDELALTLDERRAAVWANSLGVILRPRSPGV